MKIIVFAPHPDDEIFGSGGSILKWMEDGHDVSIVYVTDNRAWVAWGKKENTLLEDEARDYINLIEDELGEIGLREAKNVAKSFGFPQENIHLFKFHDQYATENIDLGIELSKEIIKNADRIVLPSDNNNHVDHQATHTMVKRAAEELNLYNAEFFVYGIYNVIKAPKENQIKINIDGYQNKMYEIMKGYKTQLCLKDARAGWEAFKFKRVERFGVFKLEDSGKFYNF